MENNEIYIHFHPFVFRQVVSVHNKEGRVASTACPTADLCETILDLAYRYNAYTVHFHGARDFIAKYAKDIEEKELLKYSEKKIKIELR